jgi:Na+-driven multidrug efflux pump
LFFAILLSVFLSLFGVLSVPYLVEILGDPSYVQETLDYINLILYGVVFFMGVFFVNALLTSVGDTKSLRNALIVSTYPELNSKEAKIRL